MLSGFPGERDEWFLEMSRWLPLIMHLQPPNYMTRIRFDRFSTYQRDPARYGLSLSPLRTYSWIYPLPPARLDNLVYFFEQSNPYTDFNRVRQFGPGRQALFAQVIDWMRLFYGHEPPVLEAVISDGHVTITDTRPCAVHPFRQLDELSSRIIESCDSAISISLLQERLEGDRPQAWDRDTVQRAIGKLKQDKLVLEHDGTLLGLPVFGRTPDLMRMEDLPGGFASPPDYYRLQQWILDKRMSGLQDLAFAQLFAR
jgi:hypothetical protein